MIEPPYVIRHGHEEIGDYPQYHEWIYVRDVRVDRRGHPNPRMASADWQFWRCNNTDCPAEAFVNNQTIRRMLDGLRP
jgi:hypothetical protein